MCLFFKAEAYTLWRIWISGQVGSDERVWKTIRKEYRCYQKNQKMVSAAMQWSDRSFIAALGNLMGGRGRKK